MKVRNSYPNKKIFDTKTGTADRFISIAAILISLLSLIVFTIQARQQAVVVESEIRGLMLAQAELEISQSSLEIDQAALEDARNEASKNAASLQIRAILYVKYEGQTPEFLAERMSETEEGSIWSPPEPALRPDAQVGAYLKTDRQFFVDFAIMNAGQETTYINGVFGSMENYEQRRKEACGESRDEVICLPSPYIKSEQDLECLDKTCPTSVGLKPGEVVRMRLDVTEYLTKNELKCDHQSTGEIWLSASSLIPKFYFGSTDVLRSTVRLYVTNVDDCRDDGAYRLNG